MTRPDFLTAYAAALARPDVSRFGDVWPEYYPRGPLIRLHVVAPAGVRLPDRLDPLGLVWYAQTGDYRSPLDWRALAGALGLTEAVWYRAAADGVELWRPEVKVWREGLIERL